MTDPKPSPEEVIANHLGIELSYGPFNFPGLKQALTDAGYVIVDREDLLAALFGKGESQFQAKHAVRSQIEASKT